MAGYISPTEFVSKYNGKAIDLDRAYGVQCVDGFRAWCRDVLGYSWPTKTGWASGYWEHRQDHAAEFDFITDPAQFQDGDWCIWRRGSKPCPSSHIAMYYQGKFFGQRQGTSDRAFCLRSISTSGIYGALRWKGYEKAMELKSIGTVTVKVGSLNIRDRPSTSGDKTGTAENGKTYEVYGIYQDGTYIWYQIGKLGWIADNGPWAGASIGSASKVKELNQKITWYLTQIGAADKLLEEARKKLAGEE